MSDWILVVDDDTSNLKMASRILNGEKDTGSDGTA